MRTIGAEDNQSKNLLRSMISQLRLRSVPDRSETGIDKSMTASPFEKLLELAHQRALKGKGGLAASVAEMCLASKASLTNRELELAFDILRLLVDKVEINVRRHIADYLAERSDVPADLVRSLAMDEIAVAYPILAHNSLLTSEDLVAIVASCSMRHRQAIAIRPHLPQSVTGPLVDHDEIEVLTTLLCNETADIGEAAMQKLVERSLDIESFREPLVHRREMTDDMARRIYIWAGDTLREFILDAFDVNPAAFEAADDNITQANFTGQSESVDPGIIGETFLAFLDADDMDGFEKAFADTLRLPLPAVTMILHDSGPETVAIAAKAADLEEHVFSEILCRMAENTPAKKIKASKEYQRAIRYFGQLDCAGATALLDRLRTMPGQRRRA